MQDWLLNGHKDGQVMRYKYGSNDAAREARDRAATRMPELIRDIATAQSTVNAMRRAVRRLPVDQETRDALVQWLKLVESNVRTVGRWAFDTAGVLEGSRWEGSSANSKALAELLAEAALWPRRCNTCESADTGWTCWTCTQSFVRDAERDDQETARAEADCE